MNARPSVRLRSWIRSPWTLRRASRWGAAPLLALAALASALPADGAVEILHRERSLYQTILITEGRNRICMQFSVREHQRNQSCFNPRHPKRMVFTYTRMMMAALLLSDEPETVLIAGLGGGTLPTALHELLPQARIDTVEIDPAVVAAARNYFGFTTSDRLAVHVRDARVFVKRATARDRRYDLVMLDAFGGDYIPEHLMTREFLDEVRAIMADGGVLAANTFATSRLYDHESETYRAAFGSFFNLRTPESNNRVILARNGPLPPKTELRANAAAWRAPLRAYDVRIREYPARLSLDIDWDVTRRPLTDQYAPANLLRND